MTKAGRSTAGRGAATNFLARAATLADGPLRGWCSRGEAHALLLEEESFDGGCARMVYAATVSRDGVCSLEPRGLAALSEVVAAGAEDDPSPSRRRRWRHSANHWSPDGAAGWDGARTSSSANSMLSG